jgi:hypothetical protein
VLAVVVTHEDERRASLKHRLLACRGQLNATDRERSWLGGGQHDSFVVRRHVSHVGI